MQLLTTPHCSWICATSNTDITSLWFGYLIWIENLFFFFCLSLFFVSYVSVMSHRYLIVILQNFKARRAYQPTKW